MADIPVMDIDLDQLEAACAAPLAGDSPAGADLRFDPDYAKVKGEIDKLTAVAAGESGVDWAVVVNGCRDLLGQRTKDLNLAAFLTLGLFKVKSYAGLAAGLGVLLGIMDNLWDQAFPPAKRIKARVNLFSWLNDRIGEVVADRRPDDDEAEATRRCQALAEKLAQQVGERIEVPVTGFSQLRGALDKWVADLPAPAEPEAPEAPADSDQAAPAAPAAAPAPAAGGLAVPDQLKDMDDGVDLLRRLINGLRALDPLAVMPYRLARAMKWDAVDAVPEADARGVTLIPAPREEDRTSLSAMAAAANWKDLAEEAEGQFLTAGTFNLDLQRQVHQALSGLGADAAARAVADEAGRLVTRLAGVDGMAFADGTPFADPQTRQWLADAAAAAGPAGEGAQPAAAPDQTWRDEALALAAKGDLAGGVARIQQAVDQAGGPRQAAERRLAAAELCLDYTHPAWAVPILEELSRHLEEVKLDQWEPGIMGRVYAGLVRGYQTLWDGRELEPSQEELLAQARRRLFEVDMALAAKLG